MGILNSITSLVGLSSTAPTNIEGPLTLGMWLEQNDKTAETIVTDSFLLTRAVRALLKDKGITNATTQQLNDTRFALAAAINSGDYANFVCPITPGLLNVEASDDSSPGNVFYEREAYAPAALTPEKLTLNRYHLKQLDQGYSNGLLGQIIAGTLVNGPDRSNDDFSHTYGNDTWASYLKTWNMLHSIPKGEFINNLDVDLINQTNRLIQVDEPAAASSYLGALSALILERASVPGRIRNRNVITEMSRFTHDEIANIEEAGATFLGFPAFLEDTRKGFINYPDPDTLLPRLQALIDTLKAEVAKEEGADVIGAAAKFCRHVIALHPYEDSNAKTALTIMNRILRDYDFAPAILSHDEQHLTLSDSRWRGEVLKGVAHTNRYLDKATLYANDDLLGKEKITVMGTNKSTTISVGGFPFGQGSDGFLYDVTGRPYLLNRTTLKPLSQMEYYFIARRLQSMPIFKAMEKLRELTQTTRELTAQINSGEVSAADYSVQDDLSARKADSEYGIRGDSFIAETLIRLMNLQSTDVTNLFQVPRERGTPISSLLSKYSQLDLDHWQIEKAMKDAGNTSGAERVRAHRDRLFDSAKATFTTLRSRDDHNALQFQYEARMYAASPLRFDSLQSAITADGDELTTIWRGDYAFVKAIGMAPNNDPRQPAAKTSTRADFAKNVVPHLLQDLKALERSGVGSQYLSHTTDLSLLTGTFATKVKSATVHLNTLPRSVAWGLQAWAGNTAPGAALSAPSIMGVTLGRLLGIPGEIVDIKRGQGRTFEIETSRRAFEMKVAKDSIIPGIVTLSQNHAFTNEQEVHGLERVSPLSIMATYTAEQLAEKLQSE